MTTHKGYHIFRFTTKGYIMTNRYVIFDPHFSFKGTADSLSIAKQYIDYMPPPPKKRTLKMALREFDKIMPINWTDKGVSREAIIRFITNLFERGDV